MLHASISAPQGKAGPLLHALNQELGAFVESAGPCAWEPGWWRCPSPPAQSHTEQEMAAWLPPGGLAADSVQGEGKGCVCFHIHAHINIRVQASVFIHM